MAAAPFELIPYVSVKKLPPGVLDYLRSKGAVNQDQCFPLIVVNDGNPLSEWLKIEGRKWYGYRQNEKETVVLLHCYF